MKICQDKKLPLVTIIVPCRNEEKFIAKCLDSVLQQNYPQEKIEVFAIDGQSEDKTREVIKKYTEKYNFIKLLDNPKKITPAGLNIGIINAKGEMIIIMGSHAKYEKKYISKCVNTIKEYGADNVGGVLKTRPSKNTLIAKTIARCLSNIFGVGSSHFRKGLNKITEVDSLFGGCYRKKVFIKIGLFNEKLIRSQDMELSVRLKKAGGKILLNPEIVSYYYPKSTLKDFFKHNFTDGIWAIYPFKITGVPLKIRHMIPLFFILSLLTTLLLGILFPLFLYLFLFILGLYLMFNLFFSIKITLKEKNIKYLILMPITFACRHFGYGLGSFWGLISSPKK